MTNNNDDNPHRYSVPLWNGYIEHALDAIGIETPQDLGYDTWDDFVYAARRLRDGADPESLADENMLEDFSVFVFYADV